MTARTWDGGGADAFWQTASNWVGDVAPVAGDQLEFQSGAARKTNQNNFLDGTTFEKITFSGNGYAISGNKIALGSLGIFDSSSAGANTLQLGMTLSGGQTLIVLFDSQTLNLGGVLEGGASLTKVGSGTLVLSGANSYTGTTTVNDGILNISNGSALGSTLAGTVINSGATLRVLGATAVGAEAITLDGPGFGGNATLIVQPGASGAVRAGVSSSWAGTVNLASTIKMSIANGSQAVPSDQFTLGSVISGNGGLIKSGAGTLILTGVNSYAGETRVGSGALKISNSSALGQTMAGTVIDTFGGTLEMEGGISVGAENLSLGTATIAKLRSLSGNNSWAGNITLVASNSPSCVVEVAAGQLTLSGIINGPVSTATPGIDKTGAGKLILSGSNDYKGQTVVRQGILNVQNDLALGATGSTTTVLSGAALELDGPNRNIAEGTISLDGTGIGNTGALRSVNQGVHVVSSQVILGISPAIGVDADTRLRLTGLVASNSSSGLTKVGLGELRLSGANSYPGSTTVSAGVLLVSNSSSLGAGPAGTLVLDGATLEVVSGTTNETYNEALTLIGAGAGGTGALRNLGTTTFAGPVNLAGDVTVSSTGSRLSFNMAIAGSGFNLTKIGAGGQLRLAGSGPNTYGTTFVNQGTLELFKSAGVNAIGGNLVVTSVLADVLLLANNQIPDAAAVTINNSGTLNLNAFNETIASLTMTGGLVTTSTGTLTLNGNVTTNANSTAATINGNLSLGSATPTFTIADGAADHDLLVNAVIAGPAGSGIIKNGPGRMTLFGANTYSGVTTVSAGTLELFIGSTLGAFADAATQGTTVAAGATLQLFAANSSEPLTLNGSGVGGLGSLRSRGSISDWAGPITLGSDAVLGADTNSTLKVTGTFSGSFGVTKVGLGVLQFGGDAANNYTGTTTVNQGTLELRKTAGVSAIPGTLIIGDGSANVTVRLLQNDQIADTAPVTVVRSLSGTGLLDLNNFSDRIGFLTLLGGNVTTGTGTLGLNSNVLKDSLLFATISGKLDLGDATRTITVAGRGITDLFIDAVISGATGSGITKAGTGVLRLAGTNTYSGLTSVNAGTLEITNGSALGTFASASQGTTVFGGATLRLAAAITVSEPLTLNGFGIGNSGALRNFNGASTWAGPITLATSTAIGVDSAATLSIVGVISGSFGITKLALGNLRFTGGSANNYAGTTIVNAGSLTLAKSPGITAVPGSIVIGDGVGTDIDQVALLADNQIADSGAVTVNATGRLDLLFSTEAIGPLTMNSGLILTQFIVDPVTHFPRIGTLILTGNVTVNAVPTAATPSALIVGAGLLHLGGATRSFAVADTIADPLIPELVIGIQISGATGAGLTKAGVGTMRLEGGSANNYSGTTTVNQGTLSLNKAAGTNAFAGRLVVGDGVGTDLALLNADNQILDTVRVTVNSSGVLDLNNKQETIASLTMTGGLVTTATGTLTLNGNVTTNASAASATINGRLNLGSATRTFTVDNGAATTDLAINALISGATGVGLLKNSGGVMQLTANNTYTGPTIVNSGELLVDGTQPQSPVTVNVASLGGKGTTGAVTSGDATFGRGSVSPGSPSFAPGFLTVGNLSLNSTNFQFEISGTPANSLQDQLNVSGSVDLRNSALAISLGFTPNSGDNFILIQNDASDPVTGTFIGLDEGATFASLGNQYRITYRGGTGNDVVLTYLNTATMVRDLQVTPTVLDEGQKVTLTGSLTDPNRRDFLTLTVNWGDGSRMETRHPGTRPFQLRHRFEDNPFGQPAGGKYLITVTWFDQHGAGNSRTLSVTVNNVAPTLFLGGNTSIQPGRTFARVGFFSDPGIKDHWTATVDYGDGSGIQALHLHPAHRFLLRHRYAQAGNFKVVVTITDDDGGINSASLFVTVARPNNKTSRLSDSGILDAIFEGSGYLDQLPAWI